MGDNKEAAKKAAALAAVEYVKSGMVIGLGTGSTAKYMVQELGRRVHQGLSIRAIATSSSTGHLAREVGISLPECKEIDHIDLTIDGADEIDSNLRLIKGGGGALLREKIVAYNSDKMIVISDRSKLVDPLGAFPLPVEVCQFAWRMVQNCISREFGREVTLRLNKLGQPFLTDGGHYIMDISFGKIDNPEEVSAKLLAIPGVVDHGLFIGLASMAIVADGENVEVMGSL